jgi:hypothetical protein
MWGRLAAGAGRFESYPSFLFGDIMICLRCGYCCKNYCVVIIDDPKKGISQDNMIVLNGDGTPCKHLIEDNEGCSCALHDYPWYKDTPCFAHGQIERGNTNCRLGEFILENKDV